MDIPKIHEGEYRFCLIMWEHEPVTAAELVKLLLPECQMEVPTTHDLTTEIRIFADNLGHCALLVLS